MTRAVALAFGAAALAAGVALAPVARAEDGKEQKRVEKRVIVRHAGGGGFLGVTLGDVEGEGRGAKVRSVDSDSPAAKAGVKEGDVIVRFDGEAVRSASHLARLVRETPARRSVPLEVARGGATEKLQATLAEGRGGFDVPDLPGMSALRLELPDAPEAPEAPEPPHAPAWPHMRSFDFGSDENGIVRIWGRPRLGIEFVDVGEQLAAYFKLQGQRGVLVTAVTPDGPAAKAGVKAGDVVLELDGKKTESGADLRRAVRDAEAGRKLSLKLQREGRPLDVEVELPKADAPRRQRGVML